MGKHLRHPTTVIAAPALFVALGGGAAWAGGLIPGSRITGATGATGPSGSTVGYTQTGATITGFHGVSLTATAQNTAIKLTGAAVFASATSYVCYGSDVTAKHTGARDVHVDERLTVPVHTER